MIFTAGLATAWQSAALFPFTTTTGTLYFISGTGTVTSDTTATITLNEATVTSGEPTNLFWGTLTLTPVTGTPLTFDIAATSEGGGLFRIKGQQPPAPRCRPKARSNGDGGIPVDLRVVLLRSPFAEAYWTALPFPAGSKVYLSNPHNFMNSR